MRIVAVGPMTKLLIPNAWTVFTYRGFRYERDTDGRFVVRAKVSDEKFVVSGEKTA